MAGPTRRRPAYHQPGTVIDRPADDRIPLHERI
jgi:hypothetical protein